MKAKTRNALEQAIHIWENGGNHTGADGCPLCQLFIIESCVDCPVMQRTSQPFCEGTPQPEWADTTAEITYLQARPSPLAQIRSVEKLKDKAELLRVAEVAFLKSLRSE